MRNTFIFLFMVYLLAGSVLHQTQSATQAKKPKLTLTAYPRQGFAPMRVSINGKLEGVSKSDKDYYCLQEEWEFGDGAVSSEQANCEPFGEDSEIKTDFFAEHIYEDKGSYTIWLILGDKKIKSKQIAVIVLESDPSRQPGR